MDIKSSLLALNLESGIDEIGLLADLSASKRRKVHDTVVFFRSGQTQSSGCSVRKNECGC